MSKLKAICEVNLLVRSLILRFLEEFTHEQFQLKYPAGVLQVILNRVIHQV